MKFNPKALPITSKALFTIVGGAVLINPVFAQEQSATNSKKSSLPVSAAACKQSMEIKRDATGVVDAISAEDIGKFPDTNLAESLQRITGVSIDRVNGEGGSGDGARLRPRLQPRDPERPPASGCARRHHHGQPRPTSAAQGTTRSFDFSTLASEGVSGLEVYKTGNAATPSGGIGATINIKTIRPLESGDRASIGVKAVMDEGGDSDVTPEVSGLFSWANDGETFGVSAFASYQDRKSRQPWHQRGAVPVPELQPDACLTSCQARQIVNAPAEGALIALPSNIGISDAQIERERINGMVTFQWAPSENTTITADAMYTSNTLAQDSLVPGIWFSRQYSYIEFDGSDVVATPVKLIEPIATPGGRGKDLFYANYDDNTKDESTTIGLNFNHKFNDAWSMDFDAATSNSKSGGDGPNGNNSIRMNIAAAGAGWQGAYYGGGVADGNDGRPRKRRRTRTAMATACWTSPMSPRRHSARSFPSRRPTPTSSTCRAPGTTRQGVSVKFGVGAHVHQDARAALGDPGLPRRLGRRLRPQLAGPTFRIPAS